MKGLGMGGLSLFQRVRPFLTKKLRWWGGDGGKVVGGRDGIRVGSV